MTISGDLECGIQIYFEKRMGYLISCFYSSINELVENGLNEFGGLFWGVSNSPGNPCKQFIL
jgi:hypothetical protein